VSDIPNDRMMRWNEDDGAVSVFRQPSHYPNGNTRDREGRLVQATGSFAGALYFVGFVALTGAAAWIFVVGPITPIESAGPVLRHASGLPSRIEARGEPR